MHKVRSRVIIVVVQVGAMKIFVAPVKVGLLGRNERQDETQFTTKIDGFLSFTSIVLFCPVVFEPHPVCDQTQGSCAVCDKTWVNNVAKLLITISFFNYHSCMHHG
jgi:hypothetical protein